MKSLMKSLKTYMHESFFDDVEDIASSNFDEKIVLDFLKDNYKIDLKKVSFRTTDSKLIVDVNGGVKVVNERITSLTNDLFEFGIVKGYFICDECRNLTSLKGAPKEVGLWFACNKCPNLTTLEGAPKVVIRSFHCNNCNGLESLEGAPENVGRGFYCHNCENLKSLKGAPKKVGGNLVCYDCPALKITDDDRKKYKIHNEE